MLPASGLPASSGSSKRLQGSQQPSSSMQVAVCLLVWQAAPKLDAAPAPKLQRACQVHACT